MDLHHEERPPLVRGSTGGAESVTGAADVGLLVPFLALMPDAALVVDTTGRILMANELARDMFAYPEPAASLTGMQIEALIPPRLRGQHERHRAGYLESPRPRAMGATLELRGQRSDGTEFPVDVSLAPLNGPDGPLVVAAVRDATERHAATAAQAQLAAIVRSTADAIVSVSVEGVITSWNPGAERLLGYSAQEAMGQPLSLVVPAEYLPLLRERQAGALSGSLLPRVDIEMVHRDSHRVDVALTVSALVALDGRVLGYCAVAGDITDRKAAEEELRRREQRQAASAEIRLALLSETPTAEALRLICQRALDLLDAHSGAVSLLEQGEVRIQAAAGAAQHTAGARLALNGTLAGRVIATGRPVRLDALAGDPEIDLSALQPVPMGPALGVPIVCRGEVRGALTLARALGARLFGADELEFAESLAGQASLDLELGGARDDRERLLLVDDRSRIARDLHDLVIQRLFAHGMTLEGLLALTRNDAVVSERLRAVVTGLDLTISELRGAIFALDVSPLAASGVRAALRRVADEAAPGLGFAPTLSFEGPADAAVGEAVVAQLVAVAREALSNIARHAQARHANIRLSVAGGEVSLVVSDDGVGLGTTGRRSGLANLRSRAAAMGGTFQIDCPPDGGTTLQWQVPMTLGL